VLGYGWMDVSWGEAEILLAVDRSCRDSGIGSFILANLEQAAAARGLNYVYNTVLSSHPDADAVSDWLGVRGYRDTGDGVLRKRVTAAGPGAGVTAAVDRGAGGAAPAAPDRGTPGGTDRGPGHEEAGGYVDVEDHRY
jgi:hypothetical protein